MNTITQSASTQPEKTKEQLLQEKYDHYAQTFQKLQLINLSTYPYRTQERLVGTYTREDLRTFIQAPELDANQKQLRKISKYLYRASPQYNGLINYLSSILSLDYVVEPTSQNTKKIKKKEYEEKYYKYVNFIERMNIQHEFSRIMESLYRDGVYCGYVHIDKDDFFFQQLDPDYCKITYFERGMYFISFNLVYFYTYPERLAMYPQEFTDAYNDIKNNIKRSNSFFWYQLKSENVICLKTDESNWYFLPPYVGTFESALNIQDFKALDITETELGNYKLLFQKIPIYDKDGEENKYLITADHVQTFHDNISSNLPLQTGILTSPMEITDISFDKDSVDRNKVAQATSQYWADSGVSELLFGGGKASSATLAKAIMADESRAFRVLYQIERWLNIYINRFFPDRLFRISMPKLTVYNNEDFVKKHKELATLGFPVRSMINAGLGKKPSSLYMDTFLENEILKIPDKFIPLSSSNQMAVDKEGGRPTQKIVSEEGEATREKGSNER